MEVVAVYVLAESPHRFDADGLIVGEFDPNGADGGRGGGRGGVLLDHLIRGVGLESELAAAGEIAA